MLLPSKILRLFVCLCFLSIAAQTAFSQGINKRKTYEAYVDGLFKHYDANKDGSLDEEEVDRMRRKPADHVDANSDGEITKAELVDDYLTRAVLKKKSDQEDSSSGSNAKVEVPGLTGSVKIIVDDETGGITLGGNKEDIAVVEARLKELNSKAAKANDRSVTLNIWIVNGTGSISFDELKGQSRESVMEAMEKLAADSAINVEQFQHDAIIGRSFTLNRKGEVPVVQSVQTRGDTVRNHTSNVEIGTSLSAKTSRRDNDIMIDFQVEKSILEDSDVVWVERDDEPVYAKTIQRFSMEAEVECEIGSVSVVSSIEGDRTWALVFCATSASSGSESAGVSTESSRKRASRRSRDRDPESRNRSRRSRD